MAGEERAGGGGEKRIAEMVRDADADGRLECRGGDRRR